MKVEIVIILILFASTTAASAEPVGNEYGFVNGWFNGQEATVKNAKLKIGEPADIKVIVTSNISGHVFVELSNPLVTEPYQVIEGTGIDKRIDNFDVSPGWSNTFRWKVKPNGDWKNGNAPINVVIQFYNSKSKESKIIEFTIANPYILDEQYTGAASEPKQTPVTTENASGAAPPKSTPFPSALLTLAVLLIVWRWRHKA